MLNAPPKITRKFTFKNPLTKHGWEQWSWVSVLAIQQVVVPRRSASPYLILNLERGSVFKHSVCESTVITQVMQCLVQYSTEPQKGLGWMGP